MSEWFRWQGENFYAVRGDDRQSVMRVTVRGFGDGRLLFEETVDLGEDQVEALATRHAVHLADYSRYIIEIEFMDEPDPLQRFFRFGTDPAAMVWPVAVTGK